MIRFKLKQLIADKEFREGRRITIAEVAKETGIHRMTLSKIANHRSYSTVTDNVDALCAYFDCDVGELMEYVREEGVNSGQDDS